MNPLLSKFFLGRDELLEQIKTFEKKRQLNLLRHLASKENEEEFLSVISEIQFGLFFDKKASTVYYEKRIDNKKPDWTFTMNGQEVIAEVVRLNPSAKDKADLDFIDGFMESIHEIEIGCIISVDFKWGAIEKDRIDFSACKNFPGNS